MLRKINIILLFVIYNFNHLAAQKCRYVDSISYCELKKGITNLLENKDDIQLFVLGEEHPYLENKDIDLITFQILLNKYEKVDLIQEISFSHALLVNNYLQFNDTTFFKLNDYLHCHYMDYVQELKLVYDNSNYKFQVIGFDTEFHKYTFAPQLALRHICHQVKITNIKSSYSKNFRDFLYLIHVESKLSDITESHSKSLLKVCNKLILEEQNFYKDIFGTSYDDFLRIILDLQFGFELRKDYENHKREDLLYKRCRKILRKESAKKYFIPFGNAHVNKLIVKEGKFTPFIKKLNDDGFNILTGYRLYTYYDESNNKKWKHFLKLINDFYGINEQQTIDLLSKHFGKEDNFIIKPTYIKGIDFILLLNKPISLSFY